MIIPTAGSSAAAGICAPASEAAWELSTPVARATGAAREDEEFVSNGASVPASAARHSSTSCGGMFGNCLEDPLGRCVPLTMGLKQSSSSRSPSAPPITKPAFRHAALISPHALGPAHTESVRTKLSPNERPTVRTMSRRSEYIGVSRSRRHRRRDYTTVAATAARLPKVPPVFPAFTQTLTGTAGTAQIASPQAFSSGASVSRHQKSIVVTAESGGWLWRASQRAVP